MTKIAILQDLNGFRKQVEYSEEEAPYVMIRHLLYDQYEVPYEAVFIYNSDEGVYEQQPEQDSEL